MGTVALATFPSRSQPAEDEDRQRLSFNFVPLNRGDLPTDQFRVMLALDFCRRTHDLE
jgi:hypothetical protein